ncbi:MAG: hypothetical protein WC724_01005 [Candidatus Paceibacterota bacterium]|jgi:hypothetical protein
MSRLLFTWCFAIVFQTIIHLVIVVVSTIWAEGDGVRFLYTYSLLSVLWLHPIRKVPIKSFSKLSVVGSFSLGLVIMMMTVSLWSFFFTHIAYILVGYISLSAKDSPFQKSITALVHD